MTGCLCSCAGPRTEVKRAIALDLNSGQGILNSIELITDSPDNWSQARFDSVHVAIVSLASCGELNKNINEDKSHMANLFTASAALLQYKADSVFRCSRYDGYRQMCKDLEFLKDKHKDWISAGVPVDDPNASLDFVSDLFSHYDNVLRLSRRTFEKTPEIMANYKLQDYNLSYTTTKNMIEGDKYYRRYFSNNSAITGAVSEFPNRLAASKKKYMDELETMIEKTAISDSLDLMQLLTIQGNFNSMAQGASQDAIDALVKFITNYVEPAKKEYNEE